MIKLPKFSDRNDKILTLAYFFLILLIIISICSTWWQFKVSYYDQEGVYQGYSSTEYGILYEHQIDETTSTSNSYTDSMPSLFYLLSHPDVYEPFDYLYNFYLLFAINAVFCIVALILSVVQFWSYRKYFINGVNSKSILILSFITSGLCIFIPLSLVLFWPDGPIGWYRSFNGSYTWTEFLNQEVWGPDLGWYIFILVSMISLIISSLLYNKIRIGHSQEKGTP